MSYKNFLIFDFGASNGRAVIFSFDGNKINTDITHRFDNVPVLIRGILYWDILRLFADLKIGIQKSLKKYKDIISIGIDAWGSDFGLLDKHGRLISNPINYRDEGRINSSKEVLKIISKKELYNLTGAWINPMFDLFQFYSLNNKYTDIGYSY